MAVRSAILATAWLLVVSCVAISGTADPIGIEIRATSIGPNPRWRSAAIVEISNDDICGTGHPINFVFDSIGTYKLQRSTPSRLTSHANDTLFMQ